MSATVKFVPMDCGTCVEIFLTLNQLKQEAKDFIAALISANIDPVGLRDQDFVWVVLRRRMESLAAEAQGMGLRFFSPPRMDAGCDITETGIKPFGQDGPYILFFCATEADAVALRLMVS